MRWQFSFKKRWEGINAFCELKRSFGGRCSCQKFTINKWLLTRPTSCLSVLLILRTDLISRCKFISGKRFFLISVCSQFFILNCKHDDHCWHWRKKSSKSLAPGVYLSLYVWLVSTQNRQQWSHVLLYTCHSTRLGLPLSRGCSSDINLRHLTCLSYLISDQTFLTVKSRLYFILK